MLDALIKAIQKAPDDRFRDRRGVFYASELCKNARDLYWSLTNEPATNPTDLVGELKMMCGSAVEVALVQKIAQMHFFSWHLLGTQIQVGGSDPVAVDGKLDALVAPRVNGQLGQPLVVEIKTKYGRGATFFKNRLQPDDGYLAQLGYYLRDLSSKGVTNQGVLLYMLMSDAAFGDMVAMYCSYNQKTGVCAVDRTLVVESGQLSTAEVQAEVNVEEKLKRLAEIAAYVKRRELPPAEHYYKYAVTPEQVVSWTDGDLRAALDGKKVVGDWQIKYSRYKELHVAAEKTSLGYTPAELQLIQAEYLRRFPNGKKRASAL